MKKTMLIAAAALLSLSFLAQTAGANQCEYHQWRPMYCMNKPAPAPMPEAPKIKKGDRIVLEGIYFDTGSAKIKKESFAVLDENIIKIKNAPSVNVLVVGYTDDRGSDAMNQKLSEARADSVRKYFVSAGIPETRVKSDGRGESNPIADNATPTGRAQNRRIEMEAN